MSVAKPIPLVDLDATVTHHVLLDLLCPKCRTHRVKIHGCFVGNSLSELSIVPRRASVRLHRLDEPCRAHFFIIDGQAVPAGSCGGWDD
jgi:hypothetical protein